MADHRYYVEMLRRGQGQYGQSCGPTIGYVRGATEAQARTEASRWAGEIGSSVVRVEHDDPCPACDALAADEDEVEIPRPE